MDTLTFGAPTLFRHLTFSEAKKAPITEVNLQKALDGLEMTMDQVSLLDLRVPSQSSHFRSCFSVCRTLHPARLRLP